MSKGVAPFLVVLASLWILPTGCREKSASPAPPGKDSLLVYIMAGQSNMAGRGLIEAEDTVTNLRILTVDSLGNIVVAREPLHFYHPLFSGLDCGMSFARNLLPALSPGQKICLVPCAISSTSVEQWLGDSVHGVKLYTNMMDRARIAMQQGTLKGVLWHQGESNAESSERAMNYEDRLSELIQKIRSDVDDPGLSFFAATLADFCVRPYKDSINTAIKRTAKSLPEVYLVPAGDLSCKPDRIHFDAAGLRELGRRFAAAARITLL